ncbi:MAG: 1-acyl-sn-glycerol-3-phosphate acyltransferase [Myxococcales bacterium]|nr:1-acyl-sn-glycerol-3-phosphate acyltransferase [Myxococcales bacterium]
MLRALIAIAVAIPLYELLRYAVLKRVRESLRRRARSYAEHHDVRVDLFKFGGKELVREELMNDRAIARAMMDAVERGERNVRDRVEEYIDEIVPAFSLTAYFQFGMKLARAAILAVYKPIVVRPPRDLPENATAVFLINHRSNFDYVVVGWALARQVAISYAVGEWARVFPLDALFKAFGGFFVRRGFPDPLYHTVLRRYLQLITRRGVTQGIFPEGGLTRDGALRSPKVGLLDSILQLSDERELYFVPVGINYDRVLEDEALLAELRGRENPPTAAEKMRGVFKLLWIVPSRLVVNVLRALTGRLHRFGYVAVAFGDPVRFRDMPQSGRLKGLSDEQRRALAKEVATELMQRIASVIPATPVPLVARAALELKCDATEGELTARVRELRSRLDERSIPTALGREFDPQRAARAELRADFERNRDLLRVETDVLASEEAEQIVRLGLERLSKRKALSTKGDRVTLGPHPHAMDLLHYYARSLAAA